MNEQAEPTFARTMRPIGTSDQVRSDGLQNAGVRVVDIPDPLRPTQKAVLVPAPSAPMVDPHPKRAPVLPTADVTIDTDGLIDVTDYNAVLHVIEVQGR